MNEVSVTFMHQMDLGFNRYEDRFMIETGADLPFLQPGNLFEAPDGKTYSVIASSLSVHHGSPRFVYSAKRADRLAMGGRDSGGNRDDE